MSDMLNPANYNLIARSFDSNKNGVIDELKASHKIKERVDANADGNISVDELAQGLRTDAVEIQNGNLVEGKGLSVSVKGVEDLRQIRRIVDNTDKNITKCLPILTTSDTPHEQITKLKESNSLILSLVNDMQSSVKMIGNLAKKQDNSVSNEISNIVKNSLNSSAMVEVRNPLSHGERLNQHSNPFNKPVETSKSVGNNHVETERFIDELKDRRDNLVSAHKTLETALNSIRKEASNLPDIQKTINFVDAEMDKANTNLTTIKDKNLSATDVRDKVYKLSNEESSKVKNRALTYGGIGLGVGVAVVGALALSDAGSLKKLARNSELLATVGSFAAIIGLTGLVVGAISDSNHSGKARELKNLGDKITINPSLEDAKLQKEGKFFYEQVLEARSADDFDKANLINQRLQGVQSRVEEIKTKTDAIVEGYSKIKEAEKK